jgi:UDP-N-acetylglucosamine:LPS N-acetylglucosamine transferase
MIAQEELTADRLAKEIGELIDQPEEITRMEANSRKLARRDAAAATVDLMEKLLKGRVI